MVAEAKALVVLMRADVEVVGFKMQGAHADAATTTVYLVNVTGRLSNG